MRTLTAITWDHSRAFPPLVAAAQRYEELNPGVRIRWEKRSLHEFGHMPVEQLASRFDLIVIDHPWAGHCFSQNLVHDLKPLVPVSIYNELAANCIGPAFDSYLYDNKLLAIPIDIATPVPSYRPDILSRINRATPRTLAEVISLADDGLAIMPAFPADLFLNWSMLLEAMDAQPFTRQSIIALEAPAIEAMQLLKRLAANMPDFIYESNPIAIAERMTRSDAFAYCPFAYSYSNYCRKNFASHPLRYGNLVTLDNGTPLRSIAGGTGIAITKNCEAVDTAADFAIYCASAPVQTGIYTYAGGQPARREAWESVSLNAFNGSFFSDTRRSHEEALLRPRYSNYVPLQEYAGIPLQKYLQCRISSEAALDEINASYRNSLPIATAPPTVNR